VLFFKTSDLLSVCSTPLGDGIFLSPHRDPTDKRPLQWVRRRPGDAAHLYFSEAKACAESVGSCLLYRPGGGANLGFRPVEATAQVPAATLLAPRWCASGVPVGWAEDDFQKWLRDRGCTEMSGLARFRKDVWLFRAWPADESTWRGGATFDSGITVAPAAARKPQRAEVKKTAPACGALCG
jgi:hypothetical protein